MKEPDNLKVLEARAKEAERKLAAIDERLGKAREAEAAATRAYDHAQAEAKSLREREVTLPMDPKVLADHNAATGVARLTIDAAKRDVDRAAAEVARLAEERPGAAWEASAAGIVAYREKMILRWRDEFPKLSAPLFELINAAMAIDFLCIEENRTRPAGTPVLMPAFGLDLGLIPCVGALDEKGKLVTVFTASSRDRGVTPSPNGAWR